VASGETELDVLLQHMDPICDSENYVFVSVSEVSFRNNFAKLHLFATIHEPEGITIVITKQQADQKNCIYNGVFNCISLQIHSSLEAVGLTAAVATKLAKLGISTNVIAGYYHDHIFVPEKHTCTALSALHDLTKTGEY
jgi:hypothetical protein